MDEMNMNETTVMVNLKLAIGVAAIAGAAVIGGIKHLKNKKSKTEEDKPKTKKKIHLRAPWTVEEVVTPDKENVPENVEETSEEE